LTKGKHFSYKSYSVTPNRLEGWQKLVAHSSQLIGWKAIKMAGAEFRKLLSLIAFWLPSFIAF
jgi:hypothetical protein